jgi:hypothetical protein
MAFLAASEAASKSALVFSLVELGSGECYMSRVKAHSTLTSIGY